MKTNSIKQFVCILLSTVRRSIICVSGQITAMKMTIMKKKEMGCKSYVHLITLMVIECESCLKLTYENKCVMCKHDI